ncbi:MAG: hypothetical protein VYD54_11435 [Bdellovibrionota bacterium]|nr:hypothetical protein [Bdellovibrionota bacterium]
MVFDFSGGQESETKLPEEGLLKNRDKGSIQIDWEIRYKLMRLHFAAEIILENVFHEMSSIEKIGTHISKGKARLEFFTVHNISNFFSNILTKVK